MSGGDYKILVILQMHFIVKFQKSTCLFEALGTHQIDAFPKLIKNRLNCTNYANSPGSIIIIIRTADVNRRRVRM